VDFADDGVTGDADVGCDLTAAQPGDNEALQLLDAFSRPGVDAHEKRPLAIAAARSGPLSQGEGRAQRAPQAQQPAESAKSVRGGALCLKKSRPHRAASALTGLQARKPGK
jgi:hypothetical protein